MNILDVQHTFSSMSNQNLCMDKVVKMFEVQVQDRVLVWIVSSLNHISHLIWKAFMMYCELTSTLKRINLKNQDDEE